MARRSGNDRPVIAIVLAAGAGSRMGGQTPKQLLVVAGRTLVEHSIAAFDDSPQVSEIVVVAPAAHREAMATLVAGARFAKVTDVVEGGATRDESTRAALAAIGDRDADVLVHDAARPLVAAETIAACVASLDSAEAVVAAIPASDTILTVDAGVVREVPDRDSLWRAQTPQGFRLSVLRRAYALAANEPGFAATDNCGVVRRFLPDVVIRVVPGRADNIKVTSPDDLVVAEALLHQRLAPS